MKLALEHTYADALSEFVVASEPAAFEKPELVFFNASLAQDLNLDLHSASDDELTNLFAGVNLPSKAYAQAYSGHQFGQYNPQLGDGRALIIGEHTDGSGNKHDLCLKGSGKTPFSRGGDGKASIGPMLREVVISEAMHALNIPTTRSLAVVTTGEKIFRQTLEPGAILCRTASSHIRIGTFQFISNYAGKEGIKRLADYSIERHYPQCRQADNPYTAFLHEVVNTQAKLVAKWMSVGFIHGVMNTDNMCISGETIDYGPCAFMEEYKEDAVFSSIDLQGRYAYQNQPAIAQWNLARLAETLLPLISPDEQESVDIATLAVKRFGANYKQAWHKEFRVKLGFNCEIDNTSLEPEVSLIADFLTLMQDNKADFTLSWHYLASLLKKEPFEHGELFEQNDRFKQWFTRYLSYLNIELATLEHNQRLSSILGIMEQNNPLVIPRNHLVQEALDNATTSENMDEFNELYKWTTQPFNSLGLPKKYMTAADPNFTQCFKTFCGT